MKSVIAAVMVHVSEVEAGLLWYRRAFPEARLEAVGTPSFLRLTLGGVAIEIVALDEKVSSGTAGTVVYWHAPQFEVTLAHMQSVGAKLYRGPMAIEENQRMCQVQDPWGNCIGLRGPSNAQIPTFKP